jgi:chromosome segregation ATPase
MVVMPRESWTDERLDDFRGEVNRRFDEVGARFDETNQRIDESNRRMEAGFAEMRRELGQVNQRLDALNDRLDGVQQMTTRIMAGLVFGLLAVLAAAVLQH